MSVNKANDLADDLADLFGEDEHESGEENTPTADFDEHTDAYATQVAPIDDLFNLDIETNETAPTQIADPTSQTAFDDPALFDEAALFGDDILSDDEAGPQPDISELFDVHLPEVKASIKEENRLPFIKEEVNPEKVPSKMEHPTPEDEERDLFGELSEDEIEHEEAEEHSVRKRLLPDGEVFVFKMPNTLALEMDPYCPENLQTNLGFKQRMNEYDRPVVELCGPENTIRWRFKEENGEKVLDENGDAVFESNAQFVEWEDGSIMLQVGDEYFECGNREETRSHLYVEEDNDLFVFHKKITRQMQVVPSGFESKTHERLLNSQINKVRSNRTVKPLSVSQGKKNREAEMEAENSRVAQEKGKIGKKRPVMDADYLEGEDDADGPSLKCIKKNPLAGFLQKTSDTLR